MKGESFYVQHKLSEINHISCLDLNFTKSSFQELETFSNIFREYKNLAKLDNLIINLCKY